MSTDLQNPPGAPAAAEAPPSTGIPAFDLELRLAGADVTDLAITILGAARRLDIPLADELPQMIMPAGDIVDRQLTRAWTIQLRGLPGTVQAKLPTLRVPLRSSTNWLLLPLAWSLATLAQARFTPCAKPCTRW